jgi:hypothetical protein
MQKLKTKIQRSITLDYDVDVFVVKEAKKQRLDVATYINQVLYYKMVKDGVR